MSLVDAQATTITFDGTAVGGVESIEVQQGEPHDIPFRAINQSAALAVPGQPDFGRCVLRLFRDSADAGQVKLVASRNSRQVRTCVVTYKNGATETFQAFCLTFPTLGTKSTAQPVNVSTVVLRISGTIS